MKLPKNVGVPVWSRSDVHEYQRSVLRDYAVRCESDEFRERELRPDKFRTAFQRDRDRILYSHAFKKLASKTQLFLTTGLPEHSRTRLTHTLEVAQVARTLGQALGLNTDLIEAIAIGHDIGHTPFGHQGERVLDEILSGREALGEKMLDKFPAGGFKHNFQGVRVLAWLEQKYERAFGADGGEYDEDKEMKPESGLNLTYPVLEGVLKHTRIWRSDRTLFVDGAFSDHLSGMLHVDLEKSVTVEGQLVAAADEIVQKAHDLEDAILMRILPRGRIREWDCFQNEVFLSLKHPVWDAPKHELVPWAIDLSSRLINQTIVDLLPLVHAELSQVQAIGPDEWANRKVGSVELFPLKVIPWFDALSLKMKTAIANNETVSRMDGRAAYVVKHLFKAYVSNPCQLPCEVIDNYFKMIWDGTESESAIGPILRVRSEMEKDLRLRDRLGGLTAKELKESFVALTKEKSGDPAELRECLNGDHRQILPVIARDRRFLRAVGDWIASMPDSFANQEFHDLYVPPVQPVARM